MPHPPARADEHGKRRFQPAHMQVCSARRSHRPRARAGRSVRAGGARCRSSCPAGPVRCPVPAFPPTRLPTRPRETGLERCDAPTVPNRSAGDCFGMPRAPDSRADCTAGSSSAVNMPMIASTTSSSTSVKPADVGQASRLMFHPQRKQLSVARGTPPRPIATRPRSTAGSLATRLTGQGYSSRFRADNTPTFHRKSRTFASPGDDRPPPRLRPGAAAWPSADRPRPFCGATARQLDLAKANGHNQGRDVDGSHKLESTVVHYHER